MSLRAPGSGPALWLVLAGAVWSQGEERVTGPGVEIHYPSGKRGVALLFLEAWRPARERVRTVTGADLPATVTVELVTSFDRLSERVQQETQSGLPGWVGGVALPAKALTLIRTDLPGDRAHRIDGILIHELAHLAVAQRLRGPGATPPPRWLDEGIAQYAEGRPFVEERPDLAMRAFFGTLVDLGDLDRSFPEGEGGSALAYVQAESFVGFLVREAGRRRLIPSLLAAMARGRSLDLTLRDLTGFSLDELEQLWLEDLEGDKSWVLGVLGRIGFAIFLIVAVVFGASRIVRRRNELQELWRRELPAEVEEEAEDEDDGEDDPLLRPPGRPRGPPPGIRRLRGGEEPPER